MVFSGISFKKGTSMTKIVMEGIDFYLIIPKTNIEKACHLSVYADIDRKLWLFMLIFIQNMLLPQNAATWL